MELDFDRDELELICVQKHVEFMDECIELLNSEWPRSKTARLVSLQQGSSEGFPTSLLLLHNNQSETHGKHVLAHAKISPVSAYHPNSCFVESVVVAKCVRGKGIGRIIMEKVEDYVRCRGIKTIYLTTHDQQGFYAKLGYTLCEPIVVYGGKSNVLNSQVAIENKPSCSNLSKSDISVGVKELSISNANKFAENERMSINVPLPLPPPPPPPPKLKLSKNDIFICKEDMKVTMKKDI